MPSIDFLLTHFYRLVAHDLVLMNDVYWFYAQSRRTGKSTREYSEVLANLLEIESANFDDINTAKLSIHAGEGAVAVTWDFLSDVVVKHLLDDLSQFPFWAAKAVLATRPTALFDVEAFWQSIADTCREGGVLGLFRGSAPYVVASGISNHRYLLKCTYTFIMNLLSKFPQSPSFVIEDENDDITRDAPLSGFGSATSASLIENSRIEQDGGVLAARESSPRGLTRASSCDSTTMSLTMLSSPHKASALKKLGNLGGLSALLEEEWGSRGRTDSASGERIVSSGLSGSGMGSGKGGGKGSGSGSAVGSRVGRETPSGIPPHLPPHLYEEGGLYKPVSALRRKKKSVRRYSVLLPLERTLVALAAHPFMLLSLKMLKDPLYKGQNCLRAFWQLASSQGIRGQFRGLRSHVLLRLIPFSPVVLLGIGEAIILRRMDGQGVGDNTGGIFSVARRMATEGGLGFLNYGLLTVVHALPGFLTFIAARALSWLALGSSLQRRHQLERRKEIVRAHISLIDKRTNSVQI